LTRVVARETFSAVTTPNNPADFFRDMLGQWEKMANQFGGEALRTPEVVQGMHGANAAAVAWQAQFQEGMAKALAAANLPSRAEIEDLSARLARVEASLERIEAALATAPERDRPKPSRGRKPPVRG
jgi:hypothetical protein